MVNGFAGPIPSGVLTIMGSILLSREKGGIHGRVFFTIMLGMIVYIPIGVLVAFLICVHDTQVFKGGFANTFSRLLPLYLQNPGQLSRAFHCACYFLFLIGFQTLSAGVWLGSSTVFLPLFRFVAVRTLGLGFFPADFLPDSFFFFVPTALPDFFSFLGPV